MLEYVIQSEKYHSCHDFDICCITISHGVTKRYLGTNKISCLCITFMLQYVIQIGFYSYLCSVLIDIRNMENLKLISVRIDPQDVDALDEIVKRTSYVRRSDLIQAAIKFYLAAESKGKGREVRSYRPEFGDVVDELEFKYHREHR